MPVFPGDFKPESAATTALDLQTSHVFQPRLRRSVDDGTAAVVAVWMSSAVHSTTQQLEDGHGVHCINRCERVEDIHRH